MILLQNLKGVREWIIDSDMDERSLKVNGERCERIIFRSDCRKGDILFTPKNSVLAIIEAPDTLPVGSIVFRLPGHDFCERCETLHADLSFCQCFYEAADEQQKEREKMEIPAQKKFWIVKKRPGPTAGILPGNTYQNKLYTSKDAAEGRARGLAQDTGQGYLVLEVVGCFDVTRVNEVPVVG